MTEQEKAIIRQMATYIELGSQGKQQITGRYSDDNNGCCALGAMAIGAGFEPSDQNALFRIFDYIIPKAIYPSKIKTPWLPESGEVRVDDVIFQLNDYAGWRFSQIVDWLKTIANGV